MSERRSRQLSWAQRALEDRAVVVIAGDRGSGRSHFCQHLRDHFDAQGWQVLTVHGISAFRAAPLTALTLTNIGSEREAAGRSIAAVSSELLSYLSAQHSLVIVDDWDDLDEASWGVICELRRRLEVPLVLTRRPSRRGQSAPGSMSVLGDVFHLQLAPMDLRGIEGALSARLGGKIEGGTLSRIFASSGGNVGLAIAICDAAVRDGTLVHHQAAWVARGDLWSESLREYVDALLEPLAPDELDLLETIALLGAVDLSEFAEEADLRTVEELEQLGLVEGYASGERAMVTVYPPLLADYFQHQALPIRGERLRRWAAEVSATPLEPAAASEARGSHSLLIRLIEARQRQRLVEARERWEREGDTASAVAFLDALADCPGTDEAVRELARDPRLERRERLDSAAHAEWQLRFAEWLAYGQGLPEEAMQRLEAGAAADPEHGPALLALHAEIECELLGTIPDISRLPDPDDEALVPTTRVAVHRAHALLATVGLRIEDAHGHLEAIRALDPEGGGLRARIIEGHVILAREGPLALHRYGMAGLLAGEERLDPRAIRAYGALCAFADFMLARHSRGSAIVEFATHLGEPSWYPPFAQLSLLVLDSVSASRQGARQVSANRRQDAAEVPGPDGPLPTQSRLLAEVQAVADTADPVAAAELATSGGLDMWRRGWRYSAILAMAGAIELDPSPARYESVREYLEPLEGGFLTTLRIYATAMALQSAEEVAAEAERLVREGQPGAGLALLARALQVARASNPQAVEGIEARIAELAPFIAGDTSEMRRLAVGRIQLSEREQEVAMLAARGLSNAEIAAELVLSRRTVENHMRRIMARLGINRRTQLKERLPRLS
ncbi:LuxR C-terminal-related transcriptional regulator [Leucobacter massiliensis]|uniref:HTH luxR-type domain-containing protein n=1 Tax=Leucobacter massiliensis TaxID=1686285 RepID=A0A2S9QN60_9MICO|nr:LuxR C-terminal-related transcriptional regulator [Leucobacter massiliensis]PRI11021.1 hypothetical protein B4915_09115 [Leucobacter massiliensis]